MGTDDGIVWFLRASEQDLGAVRLLVVEGRVWTATCGQLARLLTVGNNDHGSRALVVDLSALDYINGAGLRVFERAAQQLGAADVRLLVCGLRPVVRAAFDLAGPLPNLQIEESADATVRKLLDERDSVPVRS